MIAFTIPLRTVNPLNGAQGRSRGAVFAKAARRKKERNAARLLTGDAIYHHNYAESARGTGGHFNGPPCAVTLRRLSAGALDGDGLQAALKSIRDGLADALGVNDGGPDVDWKYEQKKCKRGEFGVEVTIS